MEKRDRSGALYVIVGDAVLHDLDAWVDVMNDGGAMPRWTRADLVRAVLVRAARERGPTGAAP